MQKEIELKCLCDGLLDALREMGLGKYSLRNYYYEGMWPLIKAYRKAGKELWKRSVIAIQDLQTRQSSQSDAARSRFCSAVNPNQANKPCLSAR